MTNHVQRSVPSLILLLLSQRRTSTLSWPKKFPQCLARFYVPDDYNLIVLSRIFQCGGECITTKLTVSFQFHLTYLEHSGQLTSILIATRPEVMVNLIVGLPFIQATGMILDMMDHVTEVKTLGAPPFSIEYCCTRVHDPIVDEPKT
jgi:hypothetical protein